MGLNQLFDQKLVFCLDVANQEELFDQVATLLEGFAECGHSSYGYHP